MSNRLILIHTVPPLIEAFNRLGSRLLSDVKLFHILDETLLEQVRLRDGIGPEQVLRLQGHIEAAQSISANAVLVTCSTLSPALELVQASIPLIKIDQAMIEQSIQHAQRIGIIATNRTTLEPTCHSLKSQAKRLGKDVEITPVLVEEALSALLNGDGEKHDALVQKAIQDLATDVEIIMLAQASMARVMETIPDNLSPVPILTSPHTALERVREVLAQRRNV